MSHNTGGGQSRVKQIELQWFARVEEAQAHYRRALEHQERMIEELDHALMEDVDGSFAVALARGATQQALVELQRRQEVLVNLVLKRAILPPDEVEE